MRKSLRTNIIAHTEKSQFRRFKQQSFRHVPSFTYSSYHYCLNSLEPTITAVSLHLHHLSPVTPLTRTITNVCLYEFHSSVVSPFTSTNRHCCLSSRAPPITCLSSLVLTITAVCLNQHNPSFVILFIITTHHCCLSLLAPPITCAYLRNHY